MWIEGKAKILIWLICHLFVKEIPAFVFQAFKWDKMDSCVNVVSNIVKYELFFMFVFPPFYPNLDILYLTDSALLRQETDWTKISTQLYSYFAVRSWIGVESGCFVPQQGPCTHYRSVLTALDHRYSMEQECSAIVATYQGNTGTKIDLG